MLKLVRSFVDSLLRPGKYLDETDQSENTDGILDGDNGETLLLNNIEIAVKTSLLALMLVGLPKQMPKNNGEVPPPKKPVNYELLAKLYKKAGENLKNQIPTDNKQSPKISQPSLEKRNENGRLIVRIRGIGRPPERRVLKESQKLSKKEYIQEVSKVLVPLDKEDSKLN